jgi:MFS family permease
VLDRLRARLATLAASAPRVYWYVWWGTLVNRLGGFVVPLLSIYLISVRKLSVAEAGGIISIYGAGSVAASIVGGQLSDRLGRRVTMLLSLFGGAASLTVLALVRDLAALTAMVGVTGFVSELYRPAVLAIVADVVPPAQRMRAYGLLHWVINIGFSIALLIGGLLAEVDFTLLFIADAATMAAYGVIILVFVPETRPRAADAADAADAAPASADAPSAAEPRARRSWLADGSFVVLVGLTFLLTLLPFQADTSLSAHMLHQGFTPAAYGIALAINGVLIVAIQPWLTAWAARRDATHVLIGAALLYGAGISMHGLAGTLWLHGAAVVVWTLGEILESPARSTLVAAMAPVSARGRYQGATVLAFGLARLVGPKLGTWTWEHEGPDILWASCLALGILVALGHAAAAPSRRRRLAAN